MTSFAVIIPVHNKERHIERTLDSVLAQSHAPEEIILIDDCSSDASMDHVRRYSDSRIKILRRDEPGPGGYAARNLGIVSATSDWVAFLDADDSWKSDHIANYQAAIAQGPADLVTAYSSYEFILPGGQTAGDWLEVAGVKPGVRSPKESLEMWLTGGAPMWTGAVAARREPLIATGMFPAGRARRGGDRDLWLRLLLAGPAAYTGKRSATYHTDADNMLTKVEKFSVRQCILDTIQAEIPGQDPAIQDLLKRIYNREVYQYALKAWKSRTPISADMHRGYYLPLSLGKYVATMLMKALPYPFDRSSSTYQSIRQAYRKIRPRKRAALRSTR